MVVLALLLLAVTGFCLRRRRLIALDFEAGVPAAPSLTVLSTSGGLRPVATFQDGLVSVCTILGSQRTTAVGGCSSLHARAKS